MLEIRLRFAEYFFITFIFLFSLFVHLVRFDINNRRHFLTYMLTRVFIATNKLHKSTFRSFNLCMFTKEDSTTINNEDRKEF